MAINGCDVSKWQVDGVPDTAFVIMKATQGITEVDFRYGPRLAECRAARKLIGSYAYADGLDPVQEAKYYVANNKRVAGEIQALDFESSPGVLTVKDPVGWALTWLKTVESLTQNKPLIYMNGNTAGRFDWTRVVKNNNGLWLAVWQSIPPSSYQWPFFIMWQNSDNGNIAPISGRVDTDIFFGDAATWKKYGSGIPPVPPPPVIIHNYPVGSPIVDYLVRAGNGWVYVIDKNLTTKKHVLSGTDLKQLLAANNYKIISLTDAQINAIPTV